MGNSGNIGTAKAITPVSIALIGLLLMGCQSLLHTPSLDPEKPAQTKSTTAPAYYYFSASQIELKKGDVNEAVWHLRQALKHDPQSAFLRNELANLYLIKKDDEGALEQVKIILDHQPAYVPALVAAGRIHLQRKNIQAAKAAFEKVLIHKPDEQHIYLQLGRIYWEESDLKNTARVFKQMVAHFPNDYTSHYFYGKTLAAMGLYERAEPALEQSLILEPALKEPRIELLNIYKVQNRTDKITALYDELRQLDPNNPTPVLGLAEHYHQHGEDGRARQLLSDLGTKVQGNKAIIPAVFESYIEPKKYDLGLWILTAMLVKTPEHSDLNYLAGVAANGLARHAIALKHLAKVAPQSRFFQNAVVQSALILHDMGHIDRAIAVVQRAVGFDPDNPDYYLYLGSFYEELERYDDALQSLRRGLDADEQNARLHFKIGLIYDHMGRKEASIKALRRVIQLTPNDAEALNYLGYTYADMGINLEEAKSLIQSALKIKPDDGYITDSLGWVYYKQGLYSEALRWLKKAASMVPGDPTILEHLGDVYLKMDSRQKALNYYQRSLEKKKKDHDLIKQKIRALVPQ